MVGDVTSPMTEGFRTRARFDDEESVTSFVSRSSLVSMKITKKERILVSLTSDISQELAMEVRMSSATDVSAEVTRQIAEIMRFATTSSNLK
jgi:hypothetical protein